MREAVTVGMIVWPLLGLLGLYIALRIFVAVFGDSYKH